MTQRIPVAQKRDFRYNKGKAVSAWENAATDTQKSELGGLSIYDKLNTYKLGAIGKTVEAVAKETGNCD